MLSVGCTSVPTFASIECREDILIAAIMEGQSEFQRPRFFALMLTLARRQKDHTVAAQQRSGHKEKSALRSALRDVTVFNARLNSLTGKHSVTGALRTVLLAISEPLGTDIRALRGTR